MSRKCKSLRAVLALLCFHMATDSNYVTVPQNVLWNGLQLALGCSVLSPHLVICLDFCMFVVPELCSWCKLRWVLWYYFNGSCSTRRFPASPTAHLSPCLFLACKTRGCSYLLTGTKYRTAGQFFSDCWLWYLGVSAFLLECFWAHLGSVCCAAQASCSADLPPANLSLHFLFTACRSSVSLLQPLFLHCCYIQPVLPSLPPMVIAAFPLASSQILHTGPII